MIPEHLFGRHTPVGESLATLQRVRYGQRPRTARVVLVPQPALFSCQVSLVSTLLSLDGLPTHLRTYQPGSNRTE